MEIPLIRRFVEEGKGKIMSVRNAPAAGNDRPPEEPQQEMPDDNGIEEPEEREEDA